MIIDKRNDNNSLLKGYNLLLYFTGSMIMYEPVEECVNDFWTNGILATLPVNSKNPRFITAASLLRESCKDKTTCTNLLKEDYKRLIAGSEMPLAPPVNSFYSHIIQKNVQSESVSDFYNAYGWRFRSRYNIPDDHLGIELLFVTLLIDNYLSLDDEACLKEMRHEIRRFVEKHLFPFISEWNELMQKNAETICYKGISLLIFACVEDIYNLMDNGPGAGFSQALKN